MFSPPTACEDGIGQDRTDQVWIDTVRYPRLNCCHFLFSKYRVNLTLAPLKNTNFVRVTEKEILHFIFKRFVKF